MPVSHSQLKAFHAVATSGGFSRAADRLCLTQPAVSDQVRKLEESYEVSLFHRNRRQVRLTELGRELLAVTQRLFAAEGEAEELLSRHRALQCGSLVLSVDATPHILPYLARFSTAYPGVRLRLMTGNSSQSLQRLLEYQADIAVVGRCPQDSRLSARRLGEHAMVAFVAAGHAWTQRQGVTLAELAGVPIVMRERGSETRQILEDEMRRAGLVFHHVIEVEGREAASELVAAGIGVGIVSAAEFGSDARIRALHITDCQQGMTEFLVVLREQASRRIVQAFMEVVHAAQDVTGVAGVASRA